MRNLTWAVLYCSGIVGYWLHREPPSITIVAMHGVMTDDEISVWTPTRSFLPPKLLDDTIKIAKKYFDFISMDEAVDLIKGHRKGFGKKNYCVLTFDDGYRNNLTYAMPILRKHKVPALIYLATDYVDQMKPFWFDRLDFALQHTGLNTIKLRVCGCDVEYDIGNRMAQRRAFLTIKSTIHSYYKNDVDCHREFERVCEQLERKSGKKIEDIHPNDPWSKVISWEEVRSASKDPLLTFGSHTAGHYRLSAITKKMIVEQLESSKEAIELHTGKECVHFAYPNGDYSKEAPEILRKCGYVSAVTTMRGENRIGMANPYLLRRNSMPVTSGAFHSFAGAVGLTRISHEWKSRLLLRK